MHNTCIAQQQVQQHASSTNRSIGLHVLKAVMTVDALAEKVCQYLRNGSYGGNHIKYICNTRSVQEVTGKLKVYKGKS